MSTYNGRDARVTVNADTTEKIVTEIGSWNIDTSADEIDTTAFGDGWGKSDVGMKKWSGSLSGFSDPADTTGQDVLYQAFLSGSLIGDIRFYLEYSETSGADIKYIEPDTVSDANAGLRVTSWNVTQDKANVASLSMNFSGSGPLRIVQTTVT